MKAIFRPPQYTRATVSTAGTVSACVTVVGRTFYRRNLLATLREREVARVGEEMAASKALPFRAATDGKTVKASSPAPARPRAHQRRAGWIGVVATWAEAGIRNLIDQIILEVSSA